MTAPLTKKFNATRRYLVLLLFLIVLPNLVGLRQYRPAQSRQTDQDTISLNAVLVVLHATVQNHKHLPVGGLRKEDFQVYEDGIQQQITSFSNEDIPVTVGLVIDNSGSMRPKRLEVIAAALAFARSSNPQDQIFVVNFNENVSFGLPSNTPFTNNAVQLQAALSRITAHGMTALYDAMAAALEHLKRGERDKKALLIISDGADNASRHKIAQIMAWAVQSGAVIYTLGLFEVEDQDRNPGVLKQFAKAGGGEAFLPASIKDVVPICEQIARDIRSQYTIAYVPSNIKQDGNFRAIQVNAAGQGRGKLLVRTRAGYYAPLKP